MSINKKALQKLDTKLKSRRVKEGFPIKVFPLPVQQLIENAEKTVLYNPDFFSAGILSASATAIGNNVRLDTGSWVAKPILWLAIIGNPGTRKTHSLRFAIKPIEDRDSISFKSYTAEMIDWEKSDKPAKKPLYSKFILSDFTPEKLGDALQHNDKGLLLFNDELMGWINSFDRYSKSGDQQKYLDLFNGNLYQVDRKTADPIRVLHPNVNILGGMQPDILKGMTGNNRDKDGFLDRFLFVYPQNLKPALHTGKGIDKSFKDNYQKLLMNLMDTPPLALSTPQGVLDIYTDWQHREVKAAFSDSLEMRIQAKMETYVWRLALVLEMMQQAIKNEYIGTLSEESMENAIALVEYFRENTMRVHDRIMTNDPLNSLSAKKREAYESLPLKFTTQYALDLFKEMGIAERTGQRFLSNKSFFKNYIIDRELNRGEYKKKI